MATDLGTFIKTTRVQTKRTRSDIAKQTGIPERTLEAYEQGRVTPSVARLLTIATVLGFTLAGAQFQPVGGDRESQ